MLPLVVVLDNKNAAGRSRCPPFRLAFPIRTVLTVTYLQKEVKVKMRFRLISKHADGIGLLYRLWQEGHDVSFWVQEKKAKPTYENILPQVQSYSEGLKKSDIVFFDMVGLGFIADRLKKKVAVYGGGRINDKLELDRAFGMQVAQAARIKVPQYETFTSWDKAIDFVKKNKKTWVFKPQDNKSPCFTYVSEGPDDMIDMLGYFKGLWPKMEFVLQEKVEGVEVSTEAWYVNGELVPNSINSTIETKRFMDGDKGPNCGCMTSVVWFYKGKPKIYFQTLGKLEKFLKRKRYSGPLDINCIVTKDGPYFLELTTRFGYNAVYAALNQLPEFGNFLADLAHGRIPKIKPSQNYSAAIRISIPPYPQDIDASKSAGRPIKGIDSLKDVFLLDAKYTDRIVTAGVDGAICEVTANAADLKTLEKEVYRKVNKIKIPDKQFRSDGIEVAKERINKLKGMGYEQL